MQSTTHATAHSILLTGCNGFVGSNLVRAFGEGFKVFGLDIPGSPGLLPAEDMFSWDAPGQLPAVDTIIHLAGKAHDTANTTEEDEYFKVNLGLTQTIFDHFLQSGAKNFIFFSSVKAVADTVPDESLTEEAAPNPQTPYGRSKLAAERYIRESLLSQDGSNEPAGSTKKPLSANTHHNSAAKRVFILRPAMIHGPGNKGNLNLLYRVIQKGIPWPLGAFNNRRSFASINNVIYIIKSIIEKPVAPGTYNVCDDTPLSTNELISLMGESLGKKTQAWKLPAGLIRFVARSGDILHLPLNSERLKKLTENYIVSNAKIKTALSVDMLPLASKQGMMQTVRSFKQNLNSK